MWAKTILLQQPVITPLKLLGGLMERGSIHPATLQVAFCYFLTRSDVVIFIYLYYQLKKKNKIKNPDLRNSLAFQCKWFSLKDNPFHSPCSHSVNFQFQTYFQSYPFHDSASQTVGCICFVHQSKTLKISFGAPEKKRLKQIKKKKVIKNGSLFNYCSCLSPISLLKFRFLSKREGLFLSNTGFCSFGNEMETAITPFPLFQTLKSPHRQSDKYLCTCFLLCMYTVFISLSSLSYITPQQDETLQGVLINK